MGGRAVVTPELIAYWEHRRDVVFPAVEGMYRRAAERNPYREPLVASARQHIALLRERQTMLSEGGVELETALSLYDQAHIANRQAALDSQDVRSEAAERLNSLRREAASATLGEDNVKGFIASAIAQATDVPVFDPTTAMPLEKVTQVRSSRQPATSSAVTKGGSVERKSSGRTSSGRSGLSPEETRTGAASTPSSEDEYEKSLRSIPVEIRAGRRFS
jgi:hypothetical protein